MAYLESIGYLAHDADECARFVHREGYRLDLETIGEFLGGTR